MTEISMTFKFRKIKLPLSPNTKVIALEDFINSKGCSLTDVEKERYVLFVTIVGEKNKLEDICRHYGFMKPLEFYML